MADEKTIEVDGGSVSSTLSSLTSDLEDFERILLNLNTEIMYARDDLKGSAYDKVFESVNELIEQQKQVLFFEQTLHDEINDFVEEIGAQEKDAVSNFNA